MGSGEGTGRMAAQWFLVVLVAVVAHGARLDNGRWKAVTGTNKQKRNPDQAYGSPAANSDAVDLHNKEFCVDVSTYQPVVWVERDSKECTEVPVTNCSPKKVHV